MEVPKNYGTPINAQYEINSKTIKSEMTYCRRFSTILDILLRDTIIDASDGEQTSMITKEIMSNNSKAFTSTVCKDRVIGNRVDMMVRSCGIELLENGGTSIASSQNTQHKNMDCVFKSLPADFTPKSQRKYTSCTRTAKKIL
ncbi:hypothetical protein INT45_005298 [Circinella minor]|uniref:Uncharacterized protein n=1 Tax=Circinella minor TaxID=1195481 RepID=A0A8H7S6Z2_9FUNG|nr:hypothetical protein INT45_005298 [Circinella minor]